MYRPRSDASTEQRMKELKRKLSMLGMSYHFDESSLKLVEELYEAFITLSNLQHDSKCLADQVKQLRALNEKLHALEAQDKENSEQFAQGNFISNSESDPENIIKSATGANAQSISAIMNSLDQTYVKLFTRVQMLESHLAQTQGNLNFHMNENLRLSQKLASAEQRNIELTDQINRLVRDSQPKPQNAEPEYFSTAQKVRDTYEDQIRLLKETHQYQIRVYEAAHADRGAELKQLKEATGGQVNALNSQLESLRTKDENSQQQLMLCRKENLQLAASNDQLEREVRRLTQELKQTDSNFQDLQVKGIVSQLSTDRLESAQKAKQDLEAKLADAEERAGILEAKLGDIFSYSKDEGNNAARLIESLTSQLTAMERNSSLLQTENRDMKVLWKCLRQIFEEKCSPLLSNHLATAPLKYRERSKIPIREDLQSQRSFVAEFEAFVLDREARLASTVTQVEEGKKVIDMLTEKIRCLCGENEAMAQQLVAASNTAHPIYSIPETAEAPVDKQRELHLLRQVAEQTALTEQLHKDLKEYRSMIVKILKGSEQEDLFREFMQQEKQVFRHRTDFVHLVSSHPQPTLHAKHESTQHKPLPEGKRKERLDQFLDQIEIPRPALSQPEALKFSPSLDVCGKPRPQQQLGGDRRKDWASTIEPEATQTRKRRSFLQANDQESESDFDRPTEGKLKRIQRIQAELKELKSIIRD